MLYPPNLRSLFQSDCPAFELGRLLPKLSIHAISTTVFPRSSIPLQLWLSTSVCLWEVQTTLFLKGLTTWPNMTAFTLSVQYFHFHHLTQ
jgi:hypothetical protein